MVHRQIAHLRIGNEGCYFLSILKMAENMTLAKINDVEAYEFCVGQGWMRPNCFVQNPAAILSYYTSGEWTVRHEDITYFPRDNEREVLRFENTTVPMKTMAHFVLGNGFGVVHFDPSGIINKDWVLVSKRIFRRKN